MFTPDNVVSFPRKKRQCRYARKGWREDFPKAVVLEFSEFRELPSMKRLPAKAQVEYMERFIRIQGLASAILVDDQGALIGGHDLLKKLSKSQSWYSYAFVVPLKRLGDKWALAEAYRQMNQGRGGKS